MGSQLAMNVAPFEHCVCQKLANTQAACLNEHGFAEQGKKVKLTPKSGERVVSIVLDGCVFTDNQQKCDGLFLFVAGNRKVAALVELKGAGDIPHAFEQLAYVRHHRPEYRQLLERLNEAPGPKAIEKAFIVSNGLLSKPEKERLERQHSIRVKAVLHCEAATPIPELRPLI